MTRVVVLGGGPAGLGAAFGLRRRGLADVTLVERNEYLGGNAASITWRDQRLDFGSHRLHPSCTREILDDLRSFLGADLVDRPRHGRIRLRGRWVHFPLKLGNLLVHLDPGFAVGAVGDVARRLLPASGGEGRSFAEVLEAKLGSTICEHFYFPYARKIWGLDPRELSAIQARRRVSASSFPKLFRKVLDQMPGLKRPGAGRFFYPRGGFGRISEAYGEAAARLGAIIRLGLTVTALEAPALDGDPWVVVAEGEGAPLRLEADHVWSTLPVSLAARLRRPAAPAEVLDAAGAIEYRAMILVYLELPVNRFSEFDAHYFPEAEVAMTRLSEPRNYDLRDEPVGRTVLCAEIPCAPGDLRWTTGDEDLGALVVADLTRAGLPLPAAPSGVHVRRLPQAYPIYRTGYERPFAVLDRWADTEQRLLTYGRQGLFAHDNTHHALAMAYAAVNCFDGRVFDRRRWQEHREVFAAHVVED